MDEEESEFPRGGKETLTLLEKRLIKQQAQQDLLFGEGGVSEEAGESVAKQEKKNKTKRAGSSGGSLDDWLSKKLPAQQKRLDIMNAKVRYKWQEPPSLATHYIAALATGPHWIE